MTTPEISTAALKKFMNSEGLLDGDIKVAFQFISSGDYQKYADYTHPPVSVEEFVSSPDFLGASGSIYPVVLEELVEINSGKYVEAVLTGGVGSGKTTVALYTTAYQLYCLSCMKHPNEVFGLDRFSETVFVFQNKTANLAKTVDYNRFKNMIQSSPYFRNHFPFDKEITSELRFPNNIVVKPVSGDSSALLGQNIFGGIIDEINFMEVVTRSRKSIDGGIYDQAYALYNTISRRRLSRFLKNGSLPGMLCLVSSRRYPGEFTDKKEAEAKGQIAKNGKSNIYIYDKRVWDVKPPDSFSGEWFYVFAGDDTRQPYILEEGDEIASEDQHLIHKIPEEFSETFASDIVNALRDIAGVATLALSPFMRNREAVNGCFGDYESILSRTDTDFKNTPFMFYPKRFYKPQIPRWMHIDLSLSNDSTGIAMGCVTGFKKVERGDYEETLPEIRIDFTLEVKPPKGGEIDYAQIRTLIYKLQGYGMNIKWISLDSYQSVDMSQILRQKGFQTGTQSVDKTSAPYDLLKSSLYDGRVTIPEHPKLLRELLSLEIDKKRDKIDHPPNGGSKDIADALAGTVYGLYSRRKIWASYGINPEQVPPSIMSVRQKEMQAMEGQGND